MKLVLVVDDHEENFYLLQTLLRQYSLETAWAHNGAEAIEMAQARLPDLVISDILMPVLDGFGLCRAWKSSAVFSSIPFIFYSATYTGPDDRQFALSLGADGFITKGLDPQAFLHEFNQLLARFSQEDLSAIQAQPKDETAYYRMYNEVLIRKLEDKLVEIEQANLELRRSEANYKHLFENNPFPMWIYDPDSLRFLNVNHAAVRKYGYTWDEFLAMTIKDIRPPEEIPALLEHVQVHPDEHRSSGVWRHRTKNGGIIFTEITSHAADYEGRPARLVMAQDVTERVRAEAALRASEANLRKAQVVANVGNWVWHIPANTVEWSDQMYHIFGIERSEFTGNLAEVIAQSIHPDDRAAVEASNTSVAQEGKPIPLEYRIIHPDGAIRTVWAEAGELALDDAGQPLALSGIVQDITERVKTEERLRLLSKAVETTANAIVITDREGKIEWVNPAYETLTGFTLQEAIGRNPRILKSGEHADSFYSNLWNTILSGKVWKSELVNKRKDGSLYFEEETITPIHEPGGRITHFVGIKQDISERKNSEKQLRESEERLRLALSAAQQGIYDLNVQTGEAVVNEFYASMLGYDPRTFVETNAKWLERLHPDDTERVGKVFQDYIRGLIPEYRVEFRQKTRSGDWKWILSIGSIVERDREGRPLRMLGTHTDITESKTAALENARLYEESQRRLQRIASLHEIDIAIGANTDLNSTLQVLMGEVKNQLGVDAVAVLLYDPAQQVFNYAASLGFRSNRIKNARVRLGNSLAGQAAQSGGVVQIVDIAGHSEKGFAKLLKEEGFQAYFGIPLMIKGKLKGVLELFHQDRVEREVEWLRYYETLAGQAALAIENAQLIDGLRQANEQLTRAYEATIQGWSMAMDLRDKETEGHTQRVTEMTAALAQRMKFSEEEIVQIRFGALLHDIGKIWIPDSILLKPGRLTEDEYKIMQLHPKFAYDQLKSNEYLKQALEIPHLHHEKWDGSGYPHGLKGDQIPLPARLFAVVDVYDALTSDRPYRPAWTHQAAVEYITEQNGKHFDPQIVKVFLDYLRENEGAG